MSLPTCCQATKSTVIARLYQAIGQEKESEWPNDIKVANFCEAIEIIESIDDIEWETHSS